MAIFALIEFILLCVIAWVVVTQVLWPAVRGKRLFPMFRTEQKLKSVLVDQEQEFAEQRIAKAIEQNEQSLHPVSSVADETSIEVNEKEKV